MGSGESVRNATDPVDGLNLSGVDLDARARIFHGRDQWDVLTHLGAGGPGYEGRDGGYIERHGNHLHRDGARRARGDIGLGGSVLRLDPVISDRGEVGGRDACLALLVDADVSQHGFLGRLDHEVDLAGSDRGVGSWRSPRSR